MEKQITKLLKEVAKEYNVEILFCVESGSRAWGMESKDSDYDVRFVFYRKPEEYTLINPKSDVITASFNEKLERCSTEGCMIDMQGFDLLKFSRMLSSSNPTVIEWLSSDILYFGEKPKEYVRFSKELFNFVSLYYHYKSMGKQNYLKYIKPQNHLATPKKYLYTCRGIMCSLYVKEYLELPPIKFTETLNKLYGDSHISDEILNLLLNIIENKKSQREKHKIENIGMLDDFIEKQLKIDEAPEKRHYHLPKYFNEVITPIIHYQNIKDAKKEGEDDKMNDKELNKLLKEIEELSDTRTNPYSRKKGVDFTEWNKLKSELKGYLKGKLSVLTRGCGVISDGTLKGTHIQSYCGNEGVKDKVCLCDTCRKKIKQLKSLAKDNGLDVEDSK